MFSITPEEKNTELLSILVTIVSSQASRENEVPDGKECPEWLVIVMGIISVLLFSILIMSVSALPPNSNSRVFFNIL